MEPQIRYTRTSDGVSLAYWTAGSGPPLVYLPPMPMHVQLEWRIPTIREHYGWLSRRHQLVRFDERGRGLSQRDGIEMAFDSGVLDLEAVAAHLDLEPFDVFCGGAGVSTAVRYAARHPDRVRRLIIVNAFAPFVEIGASPSARALAAVLPIDWGLFNEFAAYMIFGWQGGERTRQYASMLSASMTQEQRLRDPSQFSHESRDDFAQCLPLIRAPTLLIHHSEAVIAPVDSARRLAAEISDARLVLLEGEAVAGSFNDPLMMSAVDEFLDSGAAQASGAPMPLPTGMAVVLFLDIAGSTALTERMGDTAFRGASRTLDQEMRAAIKEHGGAPIEGKVMGDGVMGVFTSAAQAISSARACQELSAASELGLHIGLHAGDVIREEDNVYGGAVNIASRVCDASAPGEILVSATVRDLARTSAGVTFEDRGERTLRGIEDPVRVFAVLPSSVGDPL